MRWIIVLIVTVLMTAVVARAEESAPCRADGNTVVCDRPAFDKLVAKIIDAKARADVLDVQLKAAVADKDDVSAALKACAEKPPPEPVVIRPSALRSIGPVVLATVGAAALGVAIAGDFAAGGRAVGAVVGLAAVGVGIVLALP